MEKQEYKKKLYELEQSFFKAKLILQREYVLSNAKYTYGDVIKDHRWALIIDKITISLFNEFPEPCYYGFELKKDLTRKKNNNRVCIVGDDGITLITKANNK